jgi:hypothetical protein
MYREAYYNLFLFFECLNSCVQFVAVVWGVTKKFSH